ncbi:hypothetical protein FVEN_g7815 [Fusarium venenatum]|nr:hypothetical protein FVEN_g7815 [Fusarium venenatum]
MDYTTAEKQALMKYAHTQRVVEDADAEIALNETWEQVFPFLSDVVAINLSSLKTKQEQYILSIKTNKHETTQEEKFRPLLDIKRHTRIYTSIHDYMTKHPAGANSTRGARLYGRIDDFIRKSLEDLINSSELTDALKIIHIVEDRAFQMCHPRVLSPLRYLDVHFVRRTEDEGHKIRPSQDLLAHLTRTYFIPQVGMKVAKATCSLTLTQPSVLLFSTPFVRSMMLSQLDVDKISELERRTTKRPVYCCTSVLEQSASTNSFSSWFPGTHHWAIQIGAQDPPTTTGIQETERQMAETEAEQSPMILELERDGREIKSRVTYGPRQSASEHFLGYTMHSNRDIESFANDVIGTMRPDYHIAANNCQVFCQSLVNCILIPRTGLEILYGQHMLPGPARNLVIHYRFWDYVLATEKDEMARQCFPFSAQTLSSGAIDVMSAYTLIASCNKDQKMVFFILLAMLGLMGWNSDVGPFRHLSTMIRNRDKELERLFTIVYQAKIVRDGHLLTEA